MSTERDSFGQSASKYDSRYAYRSEIVATGPSATAEAGALVNATCGPNHGALVVVEG